MRHETISPGQKLFVMARDAVASAPSWAGLSVDEQRLWERAACLTNHEDHDGLATFRAARDSVPHYPESRIDDHFAGATQRSVSRLERRVEQLEADRHTDRQNYLCKVAELEDVIEKATGWRTLP